MSFKLIEAIQCYIFVVRADNLDKICLYHIDNHKLVQLEEFFNHGNSIVKLKGFENVIGEPFLLSFSSLNVKLWDIDRIKYQFNKDIVYKGIEMPLSICDYSNCLIMKSEKTNLLIGSDKNSIIVLEINEDGFGDHLKTFSATKSHFILTPVSIVNGEHVLIASLCADHSAVIVRYPSMDLVYRTPILSLDTLSCFFVDERRERFIIGTASGEVIFYDVSFSGFVTERYRLKLFDWKESEMDMEAVGVVGRQAGWRVDVGEVQLAHSGESRCGVLGIDVLPVTPHLEPAIDSLCYLGSDAVSLAAVLTLNGIFVINIVTFEVIDFRPWHSLLRNNEHHNHTNRCTMKICKKHIILNSAQWSDVTLVRIEDLLSNSLFLVKDNASITARESLPANSVLQKSLRLPKLQTNNSKAASKLKTLDKPLTFHTKIKSSGYAKQEPKRKLFQPLTNNGLSKKKIQNNFMLKLKSDYPQEKFENVEMVKETKLDSGNINVNSICSSNHGDLLACCLSSGGCNVLETRDHSSKHFSQITDKPLTNCHWSVEDKLLLLTSRESIVVWSLPQSRSLLSIKNDSDQRYDMLDGQFYLMDRFLHYTCSSKFRLVNYILDEEKDLFKYKSESRYNCVYEWQSTSSSTITASSSANQFYSYIMFIASADYKLTLLDLNSMTTVEEKTQCHDRKVDKIAINKGSLFADTTAATDYCFSTSCDTGTKLWDIRMKICTQFYPKMKSSSRYSNSIEFTPCGYYLCSIVGDAVDIYDIRSTKAVCSTTSSNDTLLDFCCAPNKKMIYTSTNSGKIQSHLLR